MKKIAVIGSGISGLAIAYLLQRHAKITMFEKNDYIGGHSRTIDVSTPDGDVSVDTGFIVFNKQNYPHLSAMFDHLEVPTAKSDMSFGVSINEGWLEYGTKHLTDIIAQKRNLLRPSFWHMLNDILRFNKQAPLYLERDEQLSLGQYLEALGVGEWFKNYYLLAMGACIWSTPTASMLDFPARSFIQFFSNHGLLTVNDQPQWYTVVGGSREYVKRITSTFMPNSIKVSTGVKSVSRTAGVIEVIDQKGEQYTFDEVIFACHTDQIRDLLKSQTPDEQRILGAIDYHPNEAIVHSDMSFMPRRRKAWSSWNYLSETNEDTNAVSLSYWMNNLQPLPTKLPIVVTLNPHRKPDPALTYDRFFFEHPVFNQAAIDVQKEIPTIQGKDGIWYCGAWQRYGFHEDGLLSAVEVAKAFNAEIPWALDPQIFKAKVMHKRLFPKVNQFTYNVYYLGLPLSQIHSSSITNHLAVNHSSFMSFHEKDYGNRDGSNIEDWARTILNNYGLNERVDDILLITMPRILGYEFNPVSFWLCVDKTKQLHAVICEVHNTFGENHSYICAYAEGRVITSDDWLIGEKLFHVSPFLKREGTYRFRFHYENNQLAVWIDYYDGQNNKQLLTALTGHLEPLSRKALWKAFWSCPLVTIKTIYLIHWQAVKLLFKGIKYIAKPLQYKDKISSVEGLQKCNETVSKDQT